MYTNGSAYSEVYKLKYATVADYGWNTAAYNPELSLWKVLCQTYGPTVAEKLIRFSDAYYGIYGACLRMEMEGIKDRYITNGKRFLNDLDDCLSEISQALPENHPLPGELKKSRDKQKKRFEKFSQGGAKKEGAAESWLESASGGAYMKHCGKYFTAEIAKIAEPLSRDYLPFFLGVLCDPRGELLCFSFDQTDRFLHFNNPVSRLKVGV